MDTFVIILFLTVFICGLCNAGLLNKLHKIRKQERHGTASVASGLDESLWYNTTIEKLIYKNEEKRFALETVNVLRLKYNHLEDTEPSVNAKSFLIRRRRDINGKIVRLRIVPQYVEDYPFASAVRLENGCSGTIIWNQHVLTSAHCVHNRERLTQSLEKTKVGFLNTDGTFTWFGASRIFVPSQWSKKKDMLSSLNHDYAVIKLDKPHGRRWMPFGAYSLKENNFIQFAGFPSDKKMKQMWFSFCRVSQALKHVFLNHCPAAPGMSGSGVYVYNKNDNKPRKLVAVLSSYVQYKENDGLNSSHFEANVATRLTPRKVSRICKWLDAGTNCYKLRLSKSHWRSRQS